MSTVRELRHGPDIHFGITYPHTEQVASGQTKTTTITTRLDRRRQIFSSSNIRLSLQKICRRQSFSSRVLCASFDPKRVWASLRRGSNPHHSDKLKALPSSYGGSEGDPCPTLILSWSLESQLLTSSSRTLRRKAANTGAGTRRKDHAWGLSNNPGPEGRC